MKKIYFVLFFSLILFGIILSSISVFADSYGNSGNSDSSGSDKREDSSGSNRNSSKNVSVKARAEVRQEVREEIKDKLREEKIRIRESFDRIRKEVEIEEDEEENRTRVKVKLSDGRKKEIKVMPDRALETALAVLRDKNYSLILKEVGKGNNSRVVYYVVSNETGRLLGIFKTRVRVETEIDSETGNITRYKKRWWSVFVFGEDKKVAVCHIPRGNVNNSHTIVIGAPAVRAHLRHGDYIGRCGIGSPVGNNTNVTNPPTNNTNVTIPPQNNTNVTLGNATNSNVSVNVSV